MVAHAEVATHCLRRRQLAAVALPIAKRDGMRGESLLDGKRKRCGRIESAGEQNHRRPDRRGRRSRHLACSLLRWAPGDEQDTTMRHRSDATRRWHCSTSSGREAAWLAVKTTPGAWQATANPKPAREH